MKAILIALLLLSASPAAADNYTHRAADSRKSAAVAPVPVPEEPEYSYVDPPVGEVPEAPGPVEIEPVAEPAPVEPESAALAEPALETPPAVSVPGTDSLSREVPGTETEFPADAPPAEPPAADAPKPSGGLPVTSDFLPKPPPAVPAVPRMEKVVLEGEPPHSHLSAKGEQSHRFTLPKPVEMPGDGMVIQQVWLDPQDPPQGIALRFKLASGEEVGVYWEGEIEVFTPNDYEELWYHGMLPELGSWVPLEVMAEDLGLEDTQIAGISFATFGGRALWGKTTLTEAPPLEGEEPSSPDEQRDP